MTFIIAEMSANHGGNLYKAEEMVSAAEWAGCDAVKFQLYGRSCLPDFDEKSNIPICGWFDKVVEYCRINKIKCLVSVFSWWGLEEALKYDLYAYKLASPESTRLEPDTYRRIARRIKECRRRLWVSSGPADWAFMSSLGADLLFYCPPGHPSNLEDHQLWRLRKRGFSDHSVGIKDALAAVQAGATHIEKHFKLDNNCIDAAFSVTPGEMSALREFTK